MRQVFGRVSRWFSVADGSDQNRPTSENPVVTLDERKRAVELLVYTLPPATASIMSSRIRQLKTEHDLVAFSAELYTALSRLYGEAEARAKLNAALAPSPILHANK